jgi:hypothetical protein
MNVERLLKVMVAGVIVVAMLVGAVWLFSRRHQEHPYETTAAEPARPIPASPSASVADLCREAVVLTLHSHAGVSALMTVQNVEGEEVPTESASEHEGRLTTACARLENDDPAGDASPRFSKICKPGTFVLHIVGNGKGVFDLQAKAFPEVSRPVGPLLLCNYTLDNDRAYDWVLKYQKGSRPAVVLLGSKGDPNLTP